ncbi:MAG TPA: LCP family protein, partial [Acidimicrobiales bacterium]|nr:LCP family protein [Acidimicrobiales bacterium]
IVGYTGSTTSTALAEPAVIPQPEAPPEEAVPEPAPGQPPAPEPPPAQGLKVANGKPFAPAIEFVSDIPIPDHLVFVLVIGSDARPGQDLLRSRADSIHLVAVNPKSGQGTIVGFPRDSYVELPGGGRGKINEALVRAGPKGMADTVRKLTGLPVDYYVLTGFEGLMRMVDELGGVDVNVERRMNDSFSGARFEAGWHHFNGGEALAYTRDRKSVPFGDFSRSENHGNLLLAALGKLRSEVGDNPGLLRWIGVMNRFCSLDVPADHLPRLAALARRLAPEKMSNVVLPGRVGYAGKASVVYLTQDAPALFADLRDDAVIGGPAPATTAPPRTGTPGSPGTPGAPGDPGAPPPDTTPTTLLPITVPSLPLFGG